MRELDENLKEMSEGLKTGKPAVDEKTATNKLNTTRKRKTK